MLTFFQCKMICSYLFTCVEEASQRSLAVNMLPMSPRAIELKRRLATAALFCDQSLAGKHPDESSTLQSISTRISEPDFQITRATDFGELNSLISLLDVVLDDGSHLRRHMPNPDDAAAFDAKIDTLTAWLKANHDLVNDNALVSKKEGGLALDGIIKRLKYTVRTRAPPKISLFDPEPKEDSNIPKQRDFMKNWAARHQPEKQGGDVGSELPRVEAETESEGE
jgi:hypothetical protein